MVNAPGYFFDFDFADEEDRRFAETDTHDGHETRDPDDQEKQEGEEEEDEEGGDEEEEEEEEEEEVVAAARTRPTKQSRRRPADPSCGLGRLVATPLAAAVGGGQLSVVAKLLSLPHLVVDQVRYRRFFLRTCGTVGFYTCLV